jgi:hypothetical protein
MTCFITSCLDDADQREWRKAPNLVEDDVRRVSGQQPEVGPRPRELSQFADQLLCDLSQFARRDKDTRHCVNSLSIRFIPEGKELPPVLDATQAV